MEVEIIVPRRGIVFPSLWLEDYVCGFRRVTYGEVRTVWPRVNPYKVDVPAL